MRRRDVVWWRLWLGAMLLTGCLGGASGGGGGGGGGSVCEAGASRGCACTSGQMGAQSCDDDGSRWGACVCGGGGGCTRNCTGRACGDDGCGGQCGGCPMGQTCTNGSCVAGTPTCTPRVRGSDVRLRPGLRHLVRYLSDGEHLQPHVRSVLHTTVYRSHLRPGWLRRYVWELPGRHHLQHDGGALRADLRARVRRAQLRPRRLRRALRHLRRGPVVLSDGGVPQPLRRQPRRGVYYRQRLLPRVGRQPQPVCSAHGCGHGLYGGLPVGQRLQQRLLRVAHRRHPRLQHPPLLREHRGLLRGTPDRPVPATPIAAVTASTSTRRPAPASARPAPAVRCVAGTRIAPATAAPAAMTAC
jgi:hypothetical protein